MSSTNQCPQCAASIDKVAKLPEGKLRCPSCGAIPPDSKIAGIDLSTVPRAKVIALCVGVVCLIFGISAWLYGEFTIYDTKSTVRSGRGTYRLGTSASYWFAASMLSFAVLCFFVYWASRREWYTFSQYPKWARYVVVVLGVLAGTGLLGAIVLQGDPIVWCVCAIPAVPLILPTMIAGAKLWHRMRKRWR